MIAMWEAKAREDLERELKIVEDDLDEVDDMRMAVLGQTGVHIGARELQKHYARLDSDQKRITERISRIKAQIAALETGQ